MYIGTWTNNQRGVVGDGHRANAPSLGLVVLAWTANLWG